MESSSGVNDALDAARLRHKTMLELEPEVEAADVADWPSERARRASALRHATLMDLDEVAEETLGSAPALTTPSVSESSRLGLPIMQPGAEASLHAQLQRSNLQDPLLTQSQTSSERDFLPGADAMPLPSLAKSRGAKLALLLPRARATSNLGTSPISRATPRLRGSPRLAQQSAAALAAAGLTPGGSRTHEESGLWIPRKTAYEGLSAPAIPKGDYGGYVDLCRGGPGPPPNLASPGLAPSSHVESPRANSLPHTPLAKGRISRGKLRLPKSFAIDHPISGVTGSSQVRSRRPVVRQPPVGKDLPLDSVHSAISPGDVVLEERVGGDIVPPRFNANAAAVGGLASAMRQKVLLLREQVGALTAYCDRLESAAGLPSNAAGSLPMGPAHLAAMKAAAQQLAILHPSPRETEHLSAPGPSADGWSGVDEETRTRISSGLADWVGSPVRAHVPREGDAGHPGGPDQGAGPLAQKHRSYEAQFPCWWVETIGHLFQEDQLASGLTGLPSANWMVQTPAC